MHLEGQAKRGRLFIRARPQRPTADPGFALAALLVAIAILSVLLLVALPAWRHHIQREKEAELIFRGEQYARAIGLYQRKVPGAFPPSLDILVEQKFLRKKYLDPITGEEFEPVYASAAAGLAPGPVPGGALAPGGAGRPGRGQAPAFMENEPAQGGRGAPPGGLGGRSSALSGTQGGIVGVVSKSDARSIRLYNGRDHYNQWVFTNVQAAGPGTPEAGQNPLQGPTQTRPGLPRGGDR